MRHVPRSRADSETEVKRPARWALLTLLYRNSVAALLATGGEYVLVIVLVSGLGLSAPVGTAVGHVFGGIVNFLINRYWTFESNESPVPQALRYAAVSLAGSGLAALGVKWTLAWTGWNYKIVWIPVNLLVSWAWHLPLQRYFVYARKKSS